MNCPFLLSSSQKDLRQNYGCDTAEYTQEAPKWLDNHVDDNFQIFLNGGIDSEAVWWPGFDQKQQSLSSTVGLQLLGNQDLKCSLETPCTNQLKCNDIGSRTAIAIGTSTNAVAKSQWGYHALSALQNINQQLLNQYNEMKDALNRLAPDTFNIDQCFPTKDQQFDLINALTGIGTAFSILGGFLPGIGAGVAGAAGAIASAAGSFIGSAVASQSDTLVGQKNFAAKVSAFYDDLVKRLDEAALKIFNGETIGEGDASFSLATMMKGGSWIGKDILTKVSDMSRLMHIELLCRSLNALWKTPTSNKMWVNFINLNDDEQHTKCLADSTGPQSLKYCADGGVYYTYNFIEHGDRGGGVNFPWGAEEYLWSNHKINMSVSFSKHPSSILRT